MTYVVAGVSGHTGKVVAEQLLARGEKVRVIVRAAEKGAALARAGAEVVVADLADAPALAAALRGAAGAYLLLPPVAGADDVLATQARVTTSIASAIAEARVPHVVFLSSIAADRAGTGPIVTVGRAEQRLAEVGSTRFTFLRPAFFMENFAASLGGLEAGLFQTFIGDGRPFPTIATLDIGREAAARLGRPPVHNEVVQLAGPEELTISQVTAVFSELVQRPLTLSIGPVEAVPDALVSAGLGRDMARLYAEMIGAMNAGHVTFDPALPVLRRGTPLATVARALLG
jgi:uncharacterized protein YbjT (DUF2867 family)